MYNNYVDLYNNYVKFSAIAKPKLFGILTKVLNIKFLTSKLAFRRFTIFHTIYAKSHNYRQ